MKYSLIFLACIFSFNASADVKGKTTDVENLRFVTELDSESKKRALATLQEIIIEESDDVVDEEIVTRMKAIEQEAFNYGLDNGIHYRGEEILGIYEKYNTSLQQTFNFNRFIMNGNILLPKVSVGRRLFDQMTTKMVRRVNASFKLKAEAQLVPNAPSWREYLVRYYPKPEKPHKALLPKNPKELTKFKESFVRGWEAGVTQAEMISDRDWIKLTSDYEAHLDFVLAASQNIMSYPKMKKERLAVYKTDDGKTLMVGDVIAEISTESSFNSSNEWSPYFLNSNALDE